MTTYAIGDIQGCYHELMQLLELIEFNPKEDELLLAGDLVNRGPQSLEVLRYILKHTKNIRAVLGNHDLHLLSLAYGHGRSFNSDTFEPILKANDKIELIEYVRHLPLAISFDKFVMTHAGIPPIWSIDQTLQYASEVEKKLQSNQPKSLFANLYGDLPNQWDDNLSGNERFRLIINYLTRMRICTKEGKLNLSYKGDINQIPSNFYPWFQVPNSKVSKDLTILFGHWAALEGKTNNTQIIGLDLGCVWGGKLQAYALESKRFYSVKSNH
ncbi:symmetrical bis(5'-nucleosyl)-tetraphosphatase [Thiotrichales bacterium 19S11-10]|nr:symmetrical bis(5'-nucleosyl)-tetraphosphatase [Thiotrichales bacterium 19S11-10]